MDKERTLKSCSVEMCYDQTFALHQSPWKREIKWVSRCQQIIVQGPIQPNVLLVNKVSSEHSHTFLFTYYATIVVE